MAQLSYPDPANTNALVSATYEALMSTIVEDGIAGVPGDTLPVYADSTGLHAKVPNGMRGALRGFGWQTTAVETLAIAANVSTNPRIDRVVLRLTRGSTWQVRAVVKTGTAAPTPAEPALEQDLDASGVGDGVYEIPLALVHVAGGAVTIAAGDVVPECYYPAFGYACTSKTRPAHRRGLHIWEQDTGSEYTSNGLKWTNELGDTNWVSVAGNAAWTVQRCRIRRLNGVSYFQIQMAKAGATAPVDTLTTICASIPALFRPVGQEVTTVCYINGANLGRVTIGTDGAVNLTSFAVPIPAGDIVTVAASSWPTS